MSREQTKVCPKCEGSGAISTGMEFKTCPRCNGNMVVEKKPHEKMNNSDRQALGTVGGAAMGFAAGGPFGALVGSAVGALLSSSDENDDDVGGR